MLSTHSWTARYSCCRVAKSQAQTAAGNPSPALRRMRGREPRLIQGRKLSSHSENTRFWRRSCASNSSKQPRRKPGKKQTRTIKQVAISSKHGLGGAVSGIAAQHLLPWQKVEGGRDRKAHHARPRGSTGAKPTSLLTKSSEGGRLRPPPLVRIRNLGRAHLDGAGRFDARQHQQQLGVRGDRRLWQRTAAEAQCCVQLAARVCAHGAGAGRGLMQREVHGERRGCGCRRSRAVQHTPHASVQAELGCAVQLVCNRNRATARSCMLQFIHSHFYCNYWNRAAAPTGIQHVQREGQQLRKLASALHAAQPHCNHPHARALQLPERGRAGGSVGVGKDAAGGCSSAQRRGAAIGSQQAGPAASPAPPRSPRAAPP